MTVGRQHRDKQRSMEAGQGGASTDSQRSKHRVRAHKNAKKPVHPPSSCSFPQSSRGLESPHPRLEETSYHTLPSPIASQCHLGA